MSGYHMNIAECREFGPFFIILIHQLLFQGMFFVKNMALKRKLGVTIRGRNREANFSILFFGFFIFIALLLAFFDAPFGSIQLVEKRTAMAFSLLLIVANLFLGTSSLISLKDSWRVGVLDDQKTSLIESGVYRFSRNPYFVSYLIMFAAYTILLQNIILLAMSLAGFAMIHAMVLKEEKHLSVQHGDYYTRYKERVPRYLII